MRTLRRSIHEPCDKIVIYQMGKVGSTSIQFSLESRKLEIPVFHIHYLNPVNMRRIEKIYRKNWSKGERPAHLWQSEYLNRRKDTGLTGEKWKVISLVRDPVSRNVSSFFQVLYLQENYHYLKNIGQRSLDEVTDDVIRLFFDQFPDHDIPLQWFDTEMMQVLGVDVYRHVFPKDKGYVVIPGAKWDIMLIRLESLNNCASDAFKDFLGLDGFSVVDSNVGESKDYADLYNAFKKKLCFPEEYLEKMYSSKMVKHFYTEDEIAIFKNKWKQC